MNEDEIARPPSVSTGEAAPAGTSGIARGSPTADEYDYSLHAWLDQFAGTRIVLVTHYPAQI